MRPVLLRRRLATVEAAVVAATVVAEEAAAGAEDPSAGEEAGDVTSCSLLRRMRLRTCIVLQLLVSRSDVVLLGVVC